MALANGKLSNSVIRIKALLNWVELCCLEGRWDLLQACSETSTALTFFSFFLLLTNFTAVLWNTLLYLASRREHVIIIATDPKKWKNFLLRSYSCLFLNDFSINNITKTQESTRRAKVRVLCIMCLGSGTL